MAYVHRHRNRWRIQYTDGEGRRRRLSTEAVSKREALEMAAELEARAARQRRGDERLPAKDGGGSVVQLCEDWLEQYSVQLSDHRNNQSRVRAHVAGSAIGKLTLQQCTAPRVEEFLQQKLRSGLAARTVNQLRSLLRAAFARAVERGRWHDNPVARTRARKVSRSAPDPVLAKSDVLPVLQALPRRWRPLFGVAFTTGLRKGELLGLRRADVDLAQGLLTVRNSWERPRVKSGRVEGIPLSREAKEWLRVALARSEDSDLVFPAPDGKMFRRDVDLAAVHRRALIAAGLTDGYTHKCRRKGCREAVEAPDAEERLCPKCKMRLWPVPRARAGTVFHTTRHVFATELLHSNVSVAAAQKLLRHSTPTLTLNTYGHLAPGYLREEAERLHFFPVPPATETKPPAARSKRLAAGAPQKPPLDSERRISAAQASEVLERARRESNPRPSDSKSDALSD